jgi:hypothetical protein
MKRAIAKQVFGIRKFHKEDRTIGVETPQNQRSWLGYSIGDVEQFEEIMGASDTGATYTDLGDVPDILHASSNSRYHQQYKFMNMKMKFRFTNFGEHPLNLCVWQYVANSTTPKITQATPADDHFMNIIEDNMDPYLATGTTSNSTKTG